MNKSSFIFGACMLVVLVSCAKKEIEHKSPQIGSGTRFEIIANSAGTKTVNDGLSTKWAEGDAVNVFHAIAGSKDYVNDGMFQIIDVESGTFAGMLADDLDPSQSYDWYVYYPYNSDITTPSNTSEGYSIVADAFQKQSVNDNRSHLAGLPLAGKAETGAGEGSPTVSMKQLAAVIKVVVTNHSGADLPVTDVQFTSPVNICGDYSVNFTDPANPVYTEKPESVGKSVSLSTGIVTKADDHSIFYLVVKPFEAVASTTMTLRVNDYEKSIVLDSDKTFSAGTIYPLAFDYNKAVSIATLPFGIDGTGGKAAYSSTEGVSSRGITAPDHDGSYSPYLACFDDTDDYVQVHFDLAASSASIDVKKIAGSGDSSFDVMGSADGIHFTLIETLSVNGAEGATMTLTTSSFIDLSYRYIRFVFNKGDNVGVGAISITAKKDENLRILDIGNSYTNGALQYMGNLLKAAGLKTGFSLYKMTRGGASYKNWNFILRGSGSSGTYIVAKIGGDAIPELSEVEAHTYTNSSGDVVKGYRCNDNSGALATLAAGWDIIFIHTNAYYGAYYTFWTGHTDGGYLNEYVDILHYFCPNATLGYLLPHSVVSTYDPAQNPEQDSELRWRYIVESAQWLLENDYVKLMIPYGTAVQSMRLTSLCDEYEFGDFTGDTGLHLANGLGRYIAGAAYFEALLTPVFGISVLGNSFTANISPTPGALSITAENARLAQIAAVWAVRDPYNLHNPEVEEIE